MADVDYTFAWATKNRYDVLLTPLVARARNLLVDAVTPLGGQILGTARVIDDLVQVRVRADETVPVRNLKRYMKGVLSQVLMAENVDIKDDYYGKHMFDRDTFREIGNTANGVVDAWAAEKPKYTRPA